MYQFLLWHLKETFFFISVIVIIQLSCESNEEYVKLSFWESFIVKSVAWLLWTSHAAIGKSYNKHRFYLEMPAWNNFSALQFRINDQILTNEMFLKMNFLKQTNKIYEKYHERWGDLFLSKTYPKHGKHKPTTIPNFLKPIITWEKHRSTK